MGDEDVPVLQHVGVTEEPDEQWGAFGGHVTVLPDLGCGPRRRINAVEHCSAVVGLLAATLIGAGTVVAVVVVEDCPVRLGLDRVAVQRELTRGQLERAVGAKLPQELSRRAGCIVGVADPDDRVQVTSRHHECVGRLVDHCRVGVSPVTRTVLLGIEPVGRCDRVTDGAHVRPGALDGIEIVRVPPLLDDLAREGQLGDDVADDDGRIRDRVAVVILDAVTETFGLGRVELDDLGADREQVAVAQLIELVVRAVDVGGLGELAGVDVAEQVLLHEVGGDQGPELGEVVPEHVDLTDDDVVDRDQQGAPGRGAHIGDLEGGLVVPDDLAGLVDAEDPALVVGPLRLAVRVGTGAPPTDVEQRDARCHLTGHAHCRRDRGSVGG